MPNITTVTEPITIYVMPGSQYSGKVLAALDSRGIPHFCKFISTDPKKRHLPSGGTMVPEMTVGSGENMVVVPDSEAILHWIDDHIIEQHSANFFPSPSASELSVRASDGVLAGAVLYYNWVYPESYARSMQAQFAETLVPSYIPSFLRTTVVDWFTAKDREQFRTKAATGLGLSELGDTDTEPRIRQMLLQELEYFQSLLKGSANSSSSKGTQQYLFVGDVPTAADFSVYVQVERLVGSMGDARVHPSLPSLQEDTAELLPRFWDWHAHMVQHHPLKFKGKRPPAKL